MPIANVSGTTRTHRSKSVITATASERLPHSHACTEIMRGHVATTIVAAHTIAPINGRKIHIEDPISVTMKSTASTPRVMSRWISAILILGLFLSIHVFYRSGYAPMGRDRLQCFGLVHGSSTSQRSKRLNVKAQRRDDQERPVGRLRCKHSLGGE